MTAPKTVVLSVDPEFRDLVPAIDADEKAILRESIMEDGCRDQIIYWDTGKKNLIVDGHNRHEICLGEGLPFRARALKFADRHAVRVWILRNQLGKRNLTDTQRGIARGQLYNELKGEQGGDKKSKCQNDTLENTPQDVAAQIAAVDGVSVSTVKRDAKLAEAVDAIKEKSPELAQAVIAGDIPANAVASLADAPKSELAKLEDLEGPELRKAASAAAKKQANKQAAKKAAAKPKQHETNPAKPPKSGKIAFDPKPFAKLYDDMGAFQRRVDALNKTHPTKFHNKAIRGLQDAMQAIQEWKKALQP